MDPNAKEIYIDQDFICLFLVYDNNQQNQVVDQFYKIIRLAK